MALARKEEFPRKETDVADFAKALAHPARIAILTILAKKRECICGELVIDLPLSQSTVSQHLKALKELGLIKGTIDGPRSRYCINWKVFDRYQSQLEDWTEKIVKLRQDNCC
jgi:ArsR family transcriptional regulator, arsenate/arsenite/antimonite-responsive transcriptional repressor